MPKCARGPSAEAALAEAYCSAGASSVPRQPAGLMVAGDGGTWEEEHMAGPGAVEGKAGITAQQEA